MNVIDLGLTDMNTETINNISEISFTPKNNTKNINGTGMVGGFFWSSEPPNKIDLAAVEAARLKNYTVLKYFIEKNLIGNMGTRDENGNTILHYLATDSNPKMDIINSLLYRGDVKNFINSQNNNGDTPLILAVKSGNHDLANLMIAKGADKNIKNKNGYQVNSETEKQIPTNNQETIDSQACPLKFNKNSNLNKPEHETTNIFIINTESEKSANDVTRPILDIFKRNRQNIMNTSEPVMTNALNTDAPIQGENNKIENDLVDALQNKINLLNQAGGCGCNSSPMPLINNSPQFGGCGCNSPPMPLINNSPQFGGCGCNSPPMPLIQNSPQLGGDCGCNASKGKFNLFGGHHCSRDDPYDCECQAQCGGNNNSVDTDSIIQAIEKFVKNNNNNIANLQNNSNNILSNNLPKDPSNGFNNTLNQIMNNLPKDNLQKGGKKNIKGTRKSYKNDDDETDSYRYQQNRNMQSRQDELSRLIDRQAQEIHERVVKKIQSLIAENPSVFKKIEPTEANARTYKSLLWNMTKDNNPSMKSPFDLAIEMEKLATVDVLRKITPEQFQERSEILRKHYENKNKNMNQKKNANKNMNKKKNIRNDTDTLSDTSSAPVPRQTNLSETSYS